MEAIDKIVHLQLPNSFTNEEIDTGREMMRHGLLKRGVKRMSDFYTHRNLYALATLWGGIERIGDSEIRKKLQFCFSSQVMRASRLRRMRPFGPGEQLSGTLYIAALTVETNVINLLKHAVEEYCETFPRWMLRCSPEVYIRTGSATRLSEMPDSSVDFVFTDPPFGKNIFYADCAMLWENWLRARTDEREELVVNERRVGGNFKKVEQYGQLMAEALREIFRVLKPGRFAVVEFNNSDPAVFDVVKQAIADACFRIEGMFVFDKGVKTFKQLKGVNQGEAVVDKDVMFTLAKPSVSESLSRSDGADLEALVVDSVRKHLESLPSRIAAYPSQFSDDHRTTATINSMLMNALIPRGVDIKHLRLPFIERVCARYFRKIGQRWYLRGETIGGNGGDLVAEVVAVTDELSAVAWLRQQILSAPKLTGELKPVWMRATGLLPAAVSRTLDLERLLRENFWRDAATNRWREPTAEEREKMGDDRSLRVLHDADRLANGTLGRTPLANEICDWITVLFETCKELEEDPAALSAHLGFDKTEAYRLIVKISHHLTAEGVDPAKLNAAKKQTAVVGRRLAEAAESSDATTSAKRRKDDNQPVLDLGI